MKILCLLLAASQLTPSILGCDYKLLGLEVNSYVRNMQSPNGVRVSIETIKNDLFFLSDEDKIDHKYKEENNFNVLCEKIKSEIKNERFLEFFENCRSIYEHAINSTEKYATHILLEAVKNKYLGQLSYFKKLDTFHESREVSHSLGSLSISNPNESFVQWPGHSPIGANIISK